MYAINAFSRSRIRAIVDHVLPRTGLAYLTDEQDRSWTITRSTPGSGLDTLSPGQRVDLDVEDHGEFCVASGYTPLEP